jgi:YD repeat-containing protein
MPVITSGQTGTFTLDAFGYIDVVSNGDGTLSGVSLAPPLKSNVSVSKLASTRYGPYGVPIDWTIACTNGTITYTITAGYGVGTSGGSGGGGGGSDRTAVTVQADPVNGGDRVLSETLNGIPHTYAYDAQGNLISDEWLAGGLSRTITITSGFGVASGNIYRGDAIVTTSSQMAALKTALVALGLTDKSPSFWVKDFGTGLGVEWNGPKASFQGMANGRARIDSLCPGSSFVSPGVTEQTMFTITVPAWMRSAGSVFRVVGRINHPNGGMTKTNKAKVNGTDIFSIVTSAGSLIYQIDVSITERVAGTLEFWNIGTGNSDGGTASSSSVLGTSTVAVGTDLTITFTTQYASDPGAVTLLGLQSFVEHRV